MTQPRKPCKGCGGPKGPGPRGSLYCEACREGLAPIWAETERQRGRIKDANRRREMGIKQRVPRLREDGMVWCGRCLQYLPHTRFGPNKSQKDGFAASCRRCAAAYNHEHRLKKQFGLSFDEYMRIYDIQQGRCAICRCRPNKVRLAVDHDHYTGAVRGLLCKRCNHQILGTARDSTEILERAISYLESPPAQTGVRVLIHEDFLMPKLPPHAPNYTPVETDMRLKENFEAAWREATA